MNDSAIKIDKNEWKNLRDLFALGKSESFLAYCTVDYFIRFLEIVPDCRDDQIEAFCLNGDWSDGTFVIVVSQFHFSYHLSLTRQTNIPIF